MVRNICFFLLKRNAENLPYVMEAHRLPAVLSDESPILLLRRRLYELPSRTKARVTLTVACKCAGPTCVATVQVSHSQGVRLISDGNCKCHSHLRTLLHSKHAVFAAYALGLCAPDLSLLLALARCRTFHYRRAIAFSIHMAVDGTDADPEHVQHVTTCLQSLVSRLTLASQDVSHDPIGKIASAKDVP